MSHTPEFANKAELLDVVGIDNLPGGWVGGEAEHPGGGIWTREFINKTAGLQIEYTLADDSPGVNLTEATYNAQYDMWLAGDIVEQRSNAETDVEKFTTALELMEANQ